MLLTGAKVKNPSPMRYPGGKASMSHLLARIRILNGLEDYGMTEPFAGGAGASLSLLFQGLAPSVVINDADQAIHAFWWSLMHRNRDFVARLAKKRVSMAEWLRQRDTYRTSTRASRVVRGFSAFYLNRCNRSGVIMNGGPIGGIEQSGEWKLNARFTKRELLERCRRVYRYRAHITVSGIDGIKLLGTVKPTDFLFLDPPYYKKGQTLYLNALDEAYHKRLASRLKRLTGTPWVLTYDDCPEIRQLYGGWARVKPFGLRYVASERREGRELLITPQGMKLPRDQKSAALKWR